MALLLWLLLFPPLQKGGRGDSLLLFGFINQSDSQSQSQSESPLPPLLQRGEQQKRNRDLGSTL
ncbi:hypothetical protein ASD86_10220 [Lysobacter sp. Root690]|nr:hypothetical protein ASD86_10220 [Lysobacter sp. Root690]